MKSALMIVGIVLIALGLIGLIYQGITYRERVAVVDVGPVEVHAAEEKTLPIPPIVSGLILVAGVVLCVIAASRPRPAPA